MPGRDHMSDGHSARARSTAAATASAQPAAYNGALHCGDWRYPDAHCRRRPVAPRYQCSAGHWRCRRAATGTYMRCPRCSYRIETRTETSRAHGASSAADLQQAVERGHHLPRRGKTPQLPHHLHPTPPRSLVDTRPRHAPHESIRPRSYTTRHTPRHHTPLAPSPLHSERARLQPCLPTHQRP